MRLVFDIETNGLLDSLTKLHCLVLYDLEANTLHKYHGDSLSDGISKLLNSKEIIGHNIMGFDIPALEKLYPEFNYTGKVTDTLVISRLIYTTLSDRDALFSHRQIKRGKKPLSKRLVGSHGLEAWGHRLGFHKGDYAKECEDKGIDPWAEFNEDMLDYCINDVELNVHLYRKLMEKNYSSQAIDIEHQVHDLCLQQTARGVAFDVDNAVQLYGVLSGRREVLHKKLVGTFGSWIAKDKEFTPKRDNSRLGYKADCPLTKVKVVEFNPGSTQHIANRLQTMYNWKPKVFTETGIPRVNEDVLKGLKYPEIPLLMEYLLVKKRISQVAESEVKKNGSGGSWLNRLEDGRIHGRINPLGTVTGRATHNSPNLAQVPAVRAEYGVECRKCFIATPGMAFVGADASGLELRCLAHYMARWDGGAYAKEASSGDVHTMNMNAFGINDRDAAKTTCYCMIYGGSDFAVGEAAGLNKSGGRRLRSNFERNLPAFAKLSERVKEVVKNKGYIKALDGRIVYIRSEHSALNFLLQSCGAVIMKQAMINYHQILRQQGIIHGKHYHQVLFVHDEFQVECLPEYAESVGKAMVDGIRKVTEDFDLKCPLDGEYKIGKNWAETH